MMGKIKSSFPIWLMFLLSTLVLTAYIRNGSRVVVGGRDAGTKTATFMSPLFELGPGSAANKYYFDVGFPRGHIAIKDFRAELVDEHGNPVPLYERYLHHCTIVRYFQHRMSNEYLYVDNSGPCQSHAIGQYFGFGAESRGTVTRLPDPYGVEVGNPPAGFDEKWRLNVHVVDTRGVEDRLGCRECRCEHYNVTTDGDGRPLRPGYKGGLHCCHDGTQCPLEEGFHGARRKLSLRYTVEWVDWDDSSVIPARIYILDVTDSLKKPKENSTKTLQLHNCLAEYDIEACSSPMKDRAKCVDVKTATVVLPDGGYVIYGVAHQHIGAFGSNLYGEDGRILCSSKPVYGYGKEAGNEAGYVVGITACYPQPGSVKIAAGESLVLESSYSSAQSRSGVMGVFHLFVADRLPSSLLHYPS